MPPVPVSQITAKYKQALALQSKGQNEPALAIYSQILETKPDIAEVHFQVGRIFFGGNKFEKSVFHFDIALQLKPNEPAIWDQYISSLLCNADPEPIKKAAKRLKKTAIAQHVLIALQNKLLNTANGSVVPVGNLNKTALNSVQSAILAQDHVKANAQAVALFQQNPKSAVVAELLARTFINLNKLDEARKYFTTATTLDPKFFNAFNNYGHAELEAKNYAVATNLFKSAVIAAPHAVSGLCNLADAMYFNAQVSDAKALITNAKKLHLKGGKLDLLMAEMFVRTGFYDDAQKHYRTGIKREKPSARLYFEIGDIFNAAEQLKIALEYYDLALSMDADNPEIIFHQAVAYRELGDFDATLERINRAIELAPDNPHFLAFYANSKKVEADDPVIETMMEMHADEATTEEARISLGFAISKALEDSKQFDNVFPYLKSANDGMRAMFPYDVKTAETETDEFIEYFKDFKLADFDGMGNSDARPIFVCGMPRSGTTLVEQIISSHSDVIGAGEVGYTNSAIAREIQVDDEKVIPLAQINEGQLERIGADIWKFLTHHYPGAGHITDKSIMTYKRMGLLKAAMPNSKFIVVRRDPRDNLLSIYRNRFKDNTHLYAYDLSDLGAYYKQFVRTIDFWRNQMPEGFMEIHYEDLIDDPEKNARALIDFCDLEWQDECLNFHKSKRQVKTLSVMQVRQPIYKSSLKAWQRYEDDLQPLFEALK